MRKFIDIAEALNPKSAEPRFEWQPYVRFGHGDWLMKTNAAMNDDWMTIAYVLFQDPYADGTNAYYEWLVVHPLTKEQSQGRCDSYEEGKRIVEEALGLSPEQITTK